MVKFGRALKRVLLAMFFCIAGITGSLMAYAQTAQVFVAADTELVESVETFQFRSIVDQNRAIALSKGLRCPQCQNQNLIESNSPVAKDLRLKVYQMVDQGKSDQEIIEYMTSRFGDFVLYKPKLLPSTYLLWGGPILLFILFAGVAYYSIRKQAR
ncbi:heme lyase NrfEFG subunit NrfF [Photobacterium alginatilyticum]|uniref:heme lyase NrfEFG subunit NrfF n=1 Tax=Photobacterium alginatilyticum TaxID=1775171 RepID=UPI00406834D2